MDASTVFDKWEGFNREYLEKCRGKYVAVTFSAGKDSSACLRFLVAARERYGYDLGGFLYAFPKHRYSSEFRETLLPFWRNLGVIMVYRETDVDDTLLEDVDNPCRPCQNLRKKDLPEIFSLAHRPPEEVVIVSGHSLWDLAGYALDRFAANELAASTDYLESYSDERFLEISQRFYPFLSMKGGYSVFRPMLCLNIEEIRTVCEEKLLPVLATPCRYSLERPKKVLGGYFLRFGYRFDYENVIEFARKFLKIAGLEQIQQMAQEEYLTQRF